MNHYDILGIDGNADIGQIKRAYLNLCRKYKDDLLHTAEDFSFERVHAAYATLSNAESRALYDASMATAAAAGEEWATKDYSGIREWVDATGIPARMTTPPQRRDRRATQPTGCGLIAGLLMALVIFVPLAGTANPALGSILGVVFVGLLVAAVVRSRLGIHDNAHGYRSGAYGTRQKRQIFHDLTPYERSRLMDSQFALKCKIWGMPGILDDAVEKFGQRNTALGTAGEERTAQMIEALLRIPGTRIFHGLKFPGSNNADIDHAIINGDKIVFIDSKMWAGGNYRWFREDAIRRTRGKEAKEFQTNFPAAVAHLSQRFSGQQVRAMTVIHSNDRHLVVVDNSTAFNVTLANGEDAVREIGNWFAKDLTGRIDLDAMQKLEYQLK